MKRSEIESQIKKSESQLLELASKLCSNKISSNTTYLVSEIKKDFSINSITTQKQKAGNKLTFAQALQKIKNIYSSLYDINLHIYQSSKDQTTIDIRYFKRNSNTSNTKDPMIHCKIDLPPYHKENKKFDINWQFHTPTHKWKMFKHKLRLSKNVR